MRRVLTAPRWATRRHCVRSLATRTAEAHAFRTLAATFAAVQRSKSSRDTCVSLLAQNLRGLLPVSETGSRSSSSDLAAALFLTASQLAPPHEGLELRFGAKSFVPVLQRLVDGGEAIDWGELLSSLPDYGAAVPLLVDRGVLRVSEPSTDAPLSVADVHAALVAIATEEGTGSTLRKQDRAVELLQRCQSADEMVFLVRLLAHQKLRISMGEKSILSALAVACLPPHDVDANAARAWTDAVVTAYSQLPDYGALAAILCELLSSHVDIEARTAALLRAAAPRVGVPVLTMAAYPIGSVHEALTRLIKSGESRATCEFKYDGARVQLHFAPGVRHVFSRNMEDQTDKYGSLVDVLAQQLRHDVSELVMEGEVVAIDRETNALLPFQVLQAKATTDFCLFAFDLLSLNGESLIQRPLQERRDVLKAVVAPQQGLVEFVESLDIDLKSVDSDDDTNKIETRVRGFLDASVAAGCEGLMVKGLVDNAAYRAGARSFSWMKLKHDYLSDENEESATNNGTFLPDTLDLVPIAAFYGKGRRAGVFGSFLLASFDASTGNYETIGKVGSGFSDDQLIALSQQLKGDVLSGSSELPSGYVAVTTAAQRPDVWLSPTHVWEIKATQLTLSPSYMAGHSQLTQDKDSRRKARGLALRFPRFVRVRPEKTPEQATDSAQIAMLFQQQGEHMTETN